MPQRRRDAARYREMREHPQIARTVQQCQRLLLDLLPVRIRRGDDRVAVLLLGLALSGAFERSKLRVEFQVGAGRRPSARGSVQAPSSGNPMRYSH